MGLFDKILGKPAVPAPAPAAKAEDDWRDQVVPQEINGAEARERLGADAPPVLVDVREPNELAASGKIPGAINIPTSQFAQRWNELDVSKPHIIYCAKGGRSMNACLFLIDKGFRDVSNLNGGFSAWDGEVDY